MGTVYLAEQTRPVQRLVALKLIKPGMDSKAVLARFDAERQALALMDHPSIARIFDGGVIGFVADPSGRFGGVGGSVAPGGAGQPFFVMELVNGAPLTTYCDANRLTIDARLQLFVSVCQAVQHAHQKGIIHRDLKPGNVLVTELDGRPTPKVIDFGVAKAIEFKLTDLSFADTGAIVGTPAYMSPEQADPSSMDLDTRTDVFSLGAILYEMLTGSPPIDGAQFKRGALLEVLRSVREVEPPRPSTKLSAAADLPKIAANRGTEPARLVKLLRGELDWVVMKALEKDRTRRYDSANGLAADVRRYLADEVVEARPPSRGYRLKKFVTRNTVPVTAAAAVLLALVAGITGTTWQALRAAAAADQARRREVDAVAARNEAVTARDAEKTANGKLIESLDQLLSGAARSLLRPLAVQVQPDRPIPPLNDQELGTLLDLASSPEDALRLRFVAVALRDPDSTRRLKDRSAFALHAAVGLDPARRTKVEAVLLGRPDTERTSPEQQGQLALCLAHLGVRDRILAGQTAATLTGAMTRTTDPNALRDLSKSLSFVAARMAPADATRVCGDAAGTLTRAMTGTTDAYPLGLLSEGLPLVAVRMAPADAARVCGGAGGTLTRAMTRTTGSWDLFNLSTGLSLVAARMAPADATQVCKGAAGALTQAMTKTSDLRALKELAEGLSAVAAGLEPADAADTLTRAITTTTDPSVWKPLAEGLSAAAARMAPADAARVCGDAARTLTQAMTGTTGSWDSYDLAQGLSALAARMEPKAAADTLTRAMDKTTSRSTLYNLARGLTEVVPRLSPEDMARVCGETARALAPVMTNTGDDVAFHYLADVLSFMAVRMEPEAAADTLTRAMTRTANSRVLEALARILSLVAARMVPADAARVCGDAGRILTRTMTAASRPALANLLYGLLSVVDRMASADAARVCGDATDAVTRAITKSPHGNTYSLGSEIGSEILLKVAVRMDLTDAAVTLTRAMTKTTDPKDLTLLSEVLSAVAERMGPADAARVCGDAAGILIQAMTKTTDPDDLKLLSEGLSAVLARENPTRARERLASAVATVGGALGPGGPFAALAVPQPAPEPRPLPAQTLVEVLKNPCCVGAARRLVLEQLSRHYHRPFADQWELVEYVNVNGLPLDLTTPPARPRSGIWRGPNGTGPSPAPASTPRSRNRTRAARHNFSQTGEPVRTGNSHLMCRFYFRPRSPPVSTDARNLDSIFCRAIEIAGAEDRAAHIAAARGGDAELRRAVERLVAAHFRAGSFLSAPAPVQGATGPYVSAPAGAEPAEMLRRPAPRPDRPGAVARVRRLPRAG